MNKTALEFAQWLAEQKISVDLHESYYMFNWLESTHVMFLMLSLGMLIAIDMRMLGWAFANVPASKVAERLTVPMLIGFTVMVITGLILFVGIPVRYTQSIWFRAKLILLFVAAINAFLFHRNLTRAANTWDTAPVAPKNLRVGAGLSLGLWVVIVICGRFIAYDWFDCGKPMSAFINWASGCAVE